MNILPFDTETSGIPDWKSPSDAEHQPHIVQLAAVLHSEDDGDIDEMDVIVKPDGWVITPELTEIHGISHERAMDEGIPEIEALEQYLSLWERCDLRVAHNTTFDNRIIRIALKRFMPDRIPDEVWKDKALYYCTLINARKVMRGPLQGHTLGECYKHFTGNDLDGAHNAMVDTKACLEIYLALRGLS